MTAITKFYLHDASSTVSGTLPSGEHSAQSDVQSTVPTLKNTARTMDGTIGTGQVDCSYNTLGSAAAQRTFLRMFCSAPLAAQSIDAGNWQVSMAGKEGNADSNLHFTCVIYAWRPSTGAVVGSLISDFAASTGEPGTTQTAVNDTTIAGTAVNILAGDILVCEIWRDATVPGSSTVRTNDFYYDGTIEASTTNCASFLVPCQPIYPLGDMGPTFAINAGFPMGAGAGNVNTTTVSAPTAAVGDVIYMFVGINSNTITSTGASSSRTTGWTKVANFDDSTSTWRIDVWRGTVTSTGTHTITVTYSASVAAVTGEIDLISFHSTRSTPWWWESSTGAQHDATSTTPAFPTLTPPVNGPFAYIGVCEPAQTAQVGATTFYNYTVLDASWLTAAYSIGVTGAQTPASSQSPTGTATTMGLLISDVVNSTGSMGLKKPSLSLAGKETISGTGSMGLKKPKLDLSDTTRHTLKQNFDAIGNGVNITTGNTTFDTVTTGGGTATLQGDTTTSRGAASAKIKNASVGSNADFMQWSTSFGTNSKVYFRLELYVPSALSGVGFTFYTPALTGTVRSRIGLSSANKVIVLNAALSTVITSSTTIPFDQWFRVEGYVVCDSDTSVGRAEIQIFTGVADITPAELKSVFDNFGGISNQQNLGLAVAHADMPAFYVDHIGVSNVGYLGAVNYGSGGCGLKKPAISGAGGPGTGGVTGTGSMGLKKPSLSLAGKEKISSTGSIGLKKPSISIAAKEKYILTGGCGLKKPALSETAVEKYILTGGCGLKKPSLSLAGNRKYYVTGGVSLKKPSLSQSGFESITGTGSISLKKPSIQGEFIGPVTYYKLFPSTNGPSNATSGDDSLYVFGIHFKATDTNIKFYGYRIWVASDQDTATQDLALWHWTSDPATLVSNSFLATGTLTAGQWNEFLLSTPIDLVNGEEYIAVRSVNKAGHVGGNYYSHTAHYWDSGAGASGITNGPLNAYNSSTEPEGKGQMTFHVVSSGTPDVTNATHFPTDVFNATHYWSDVIVGSPTTSITGTGSAGLKKPSLSLAGTEKYILTGGCGLKKPSLSLAAKEKYSLSGGCGLKKPSISIAAKEKYTLTGGCGLKKPSLSLAAKEKFTLTGGVSLKKPSIFASSSNNVSATGGVGLKKPSLSLSAREKISGTGSCGLKKPHISGTIREEIAATGSVSLKKPQLTISSKEREALSGGVSLKKPHISASATVSYHSSGTGSMGLKKPHLDLVGSETIFATGSMHMKKARIEAHEFSQPSNSLFMFTSV